MRFGCLALLLALLLLTVGCQPKGNSDFEDTAVTACYGDDWTLEMTLENVTPTGATVVFTHQGDGVNIATGAFYSIEKYENGKWIELEAFGDACLNAIGYFVPNNSTLTIETSWEHLYGTLPRGKYRICKDVRFEGRRTNEYEGVERIENYIEDTVYYAEFTYA